MTQFASKHRISTGYISEHGLKSQKAAGTAWKLSEQDCFQLEMWQWKPQAFYVSRNHGKEEPTYTIFADVKETETGTVYSQPVGRGFVPRECSTYIQLYFNFPKATAFIDLYPEN